MVTKTQKIINNKQGDKSKDEHQKNLQKSNNGLKMHPIKIF